MQQYYQQQQQQPFYYGGYYQQQQQQHQQHSQQQMGGAQYMHHMQAQAGYYYPNPYGYVMLVHRMYERQGHLPLLCICGSDLCSYDYFVLSKILNTCGLRWTAQFIFNVKHFLL